MTTRVTNSPVFHAHTVLLEPLNLPEFSAASPHRRGGGGGGGARDETPASAGRLPRADVREFTPPLLKPIVEHPQLEMEPTILAPPDAQLPSINLAQFGLPNGVSGPPSQGHGTRGGFGNGIEGGAGDDVGGGYDHGRKGGAGGDDFGPGGSGSGRLTEPVVLWKPEPEYSEDARKARMQGVVVLSIEIDAQGRAQDIAVIHGLGLGLDERAIASVKLWRFRPATRYGKPIPVRARVEVNFRLL
jgi:protein TonB